MKALNYESRTFPTKREAAEAADWHRRKGHKVGDNEGWGLRRFICDTCEQNFYWIYQ